MTTKSGRSLQIAPPHLHPSKGFGANSAYLLQYIHNLTVIRICVQQLFGNDRISFGTVLLLSSFHFSLFPIIFFMQLLQFFRW